MSSRILDIGSKNGRSSAVIHAFEELEREINIETAGTGMGDLFDHKVVIQSGNVCINNDELDVEFDIPFDDDTEADESELIIYNISDTTIQGFKEHELITVTAGYGSDVGVIMNGRISKVHTVFEDLDKITTIYVLDSEDRKEKKLENVAYGGGTAASTILKDLVSKVGLPVAVFSVKRDYTYKDGMTVSGGLMETIKRQAQVCGVSAYINKGQIYVRPITEGDALSFQLSSDTGLISLSEFEEEITAQDYVDIVKGYEITMLLQHRVTTGSIINLQSRNVSGAYRVREGSHMYDGTDFLTKVKAIECPVPATQEAEKNTKTAGLPDLSSYSGVSIVDALSQAGCDSSFANRKKIAEQIGIAGYSGTAEQNLSMLKMLGAKTGG